MILNIVTRTQTGFNDERLLRLRDKIIFIRHRALKRGGVYEAWVGEWR